MERGFPECTENLFNLQPFKFWVLKIFDAKPLHGTIDAKRVITGPVDRNSHFQVDSLLPRVNNFAQLARLNLTIPGHLFTSCSITKKILCSLIVHRGLALYGKRNYNNQRK